MLNPEQTRQTVRDVVTRIARRPVKDGQPLVSSGLIDSLSILQLIEQIQTALNISIPINRVQPDDFDSIDLIIETLDRVANAP